MSGGEAGIGVEAEELRGRGARERGGSSLDVGITRLMAETGWGGRDLPGSNSRVGRTARRSVMVEISREGQAVRCSDQL